MRIFFLFLSQKKKDSNINCGSLSEVLPTLGIQVSDVENSYSNGDIYASILSKTDVNNNNNNSQWSNWTLLTNENNCNVFLPNKYNYFSNFATITQEWIAISLFNCDSDGLNITTTVITTTTEEEEETTSSETTLNPSSNTKNSNNSKNSIQFEIYILLLLLLRVRIV